MIALPHPPTSTAPHTLGSLDDVTTLPTLTPVERDYVVRALAALPRPNRAERRRRARARRSR